jgi:hypothetical protein
MKGAGSDMGPLEKPTKV